MKIKIKSAPGIKMDTKSGYSFALKLHYKQKKKINFIYISINIFL